jgi:hypothetical protein
LLSRRASFDPDHERRTLGHSGPELSARLLQRWRLPAVITDAVHGRDPDSDKRTPLVRTVRRAVLLAELLGAGAMPTDDELETLALTHDEYDAVLTGLPGAGAIDRYARALDEFVANSRANNPTTPSVGAIVLQIGAAADIVERHGEPAHTPPPQRWPNSSAPR